MRSLAKKVPLRVEAADALFVDAQGVGRVAADAERKCLDRDHEARVHAIHAQ
jgi:hypothetical protein